MDFASAVISVAPSRWTLVVESILHLVRPPGGISSLVPIIKSDAEITCIAGEDVILGRIGPEEKIGGAVVGGCGKPRVEVAHGVGGRNVVAVEIVVSIGKTIDIGGIRRGDVIANDGKVFRTCALGFDAGDSK